MAVMWCMGGAHVCASTYDMWTSNLNPKKILDAPFFKAVSFESTSSWTTGPEVIAVWCSYVLDWSKQGGWGKRDKMEAKSVSALLSHQTDTFNWMRLTVVRSLMKTVFLLVIKPKEQICCSKEKTVHHPNTFASYQLSIKCNPLGFIRTMRHPNVQWTHMWVIQNALAYQLTWRKSVYTKLGWNPGG